MPDKQKGSPVLEHQTNHGEVFNKSISQDNEFIPHILSELCDADLAVKNGDIAFSRQMVRIEDLKHLRRGDGSETWTQANT